MKRMMCTLALTGLVLLSGACSGDKNKQPAGGTEDRHAAAVAYAKCMRDNGDPAWPDPAPDGGFPNNDGSLDRTSEAFKKADAACKDLAPQGAPAGAAVEADFQKLLAYSKCMRDHGVAKYPDPVKDDGGVGIEEGKDVDHNAASYKTAAEACKSLQVGPAGK